jgi:DNA-binding NtrC family response regulator
MNLDWLRSPDRQMEKVVQHIEQVAYSPLTILVEGETGTGKELVARAIHYVSARHMKPFIAVDCGAVPESLIEPEINGYGNGDPGTEPQKGGWFQLAEGGSLFLDEVANLHVRTQGKLLRAMQDRELRWPRSPPSVRVNARIIAASSIPLEREVGAGRFREDLYYRLNEFVINLPPLRERDDILQLANEFAEEASIELGRPTRSISEAAAQVLLHYPWPGNVRQLRNVIRRATLLASDMIEPEHLAFFIVEANPRNANPVQPSPGSSLKEIAEAAIADAERRAIHRVLRFTRGNQSEAARCLKTDHETLNLKMRQYDILSTPFRNP